ncbi:SAM-dependent methyltransferase [Micromonospora aurantiaca (nom. illeg.)]|uniref:SAM-dependent methyltransferase n=1 Tax=Micromonospora aurantiaca (nom. illeg.) TaxID=47850 RepID=UPI003F4A01A6
MTRDKAAPPGIDVTVPSVARVYDYFLGGKDNFEVDRKVAEHALRITPDGPAAGQANRAFLRRVIRYLVTEAGIDQFLDIGSGLPTQGNVHEVAIEHNPAARVVYVDNDPIVLAHGRALLAAEGTATVIQADIREPEEILNDPDVRRFLDFDRPIGLLLFAILHHIGDDEDPRSVAAALIDALPSGSYVAISHFRDPGERDPEGSRKAREVERVFNESLGTGRWRTDEEILAFADGLTPLEPGLVPLAEWRPDPDAPAPAADRHLPHLRRAARPQAVGTASPRRYDPKRGCRSAPR